MGLSSKQVSSSGLDWKQTLLEAQNLELAKPNLMKKQQTSHQPSESLKCPRCDSTNTKFCYYNNYNKSQPRHFCRACKRHWTKGGTLRNVPVGGGRKNKRVKKSTTPASSSTTSTSIGNLDGGLSSHVAIQTTTTPLVDPKNISSSSYCSSLYQPPLMLQQNNNNDNNLMMNLLESRGFGVGDGIFVSASTSTLTPFLPQNQGLVFNFSSSSSFVDTNSCSVSTSMRSSNVYNYGVEEPTTNNSQPWEIPATSGSGAMEASNYWNWEDIDSLVSTDLKDPWNDSDVKP